MVSQLMSVRMSVPSKSTARGRGFSSCVTHRGGLASPVNASLVMMDRATEAKR